MIYVFIIFLCQSGWDVFLQTEREPKNRLRLDCSLTILCSRPDTDFSSRFCWPSLCLDKEYRRGESRYMYSHHAWLDFVHETTLLYNSRVQQMLSQVRIYGYRVEITEIHIIYPAASKY